MVSRLIAAVVLALSVASVSAVPAEVSAFSGPRPVTAAPPSTEPAAGAPTTTVLVNDFIPEEANIGDCISALPRPECGSKARGGWRQALVFVVLIAAIAAIGLRLVLAVRKRGHRAA